MNSTDPTATEEPPAISGLQRSNGYLVATASRGCSRRGDQDSSTHSSPRFSRHWVLRGERVSHLIVTARNGTNRKRRQLRRANRSRQDNRIHCGRSGTELGSEGTRPRLPSKIYPRDEHGALCNVANAYQIAAGCRVSRIYARHTPRARGPSLMTMTRRPQSRVSTCLYSVRGHAEGVGFMRSQREMRKPRFGPQACMCRFCYIQNNQWRATGGQQSS
jgi:hypothetical protein